MRLVPRLLVRAEQPAASAVSGFTVWDFPDSVRVSLEQEAAMRDSYHRSPLRRRLASYALVGSMALLMPQSLHSGTISIPFSPANFPNPLNITNRFLAFEVGKKFVY